MPKNQGYYTFTIIKPWLIFIRVWTDFDVGFETQSDHIILGLLQTALAGLRMTNC